MTLTVIEKNDEIITIEKIENGMEIGYVQKKKHGKLDMEKYHFMRNIEPLWFSENSISIFKKLGIDTTFQRARDFTNLFDGDLSGFYYLSASSNGTDESAKIILGYISETFKNRNIDIKKINYYIPASWLKQLIIDIESGKIPKKFQKDFIDEFIEEEDKSKDINEMINSLLKLSKYEVMDNSLIEGFIDQVFENNPDAVNEAVKNPKKAGWLTGQVMKISERKASPQEAAKLIEQRLEKLRNV